MLSLPSVDYGSCITCQGIELWQVKAKESKQANFNFHFHTSTDQKGILLERVEAPSQDIEGVFGIKVGMEEELQSNHSKRRLQLPNRIRKGIRLSFSLLTITGTIT